jgi:hypothetical protein
VTASRGELPEEPPHCTKKTKEILNKYVYVRCFIPMTTAAQYNERSSTMSDVLTLRNSSIAWSRYGMNKNRSVNVKNQSEIVDSMSIPAHLSLA